MDFANNNILMILISLVFIYAVLSILVSILVEWLNYLTKERGKHLHDSIHNLILDEKNGIMGEKFYNHVMINGLQSLRNRLPAYISSGMFSEALVDIIAQQAEKEGVTPNNQPTEGVDENNKPVKQMMVRFENGVNAMESSDFKSLLQSFIDKSGKDYTQLKTHLENWYNDYMERVSGGYKLKQRRKLIFIGFIVAIALNVDSLHLLKVLSLDDNLKNNLVKTAEMAADNYRVNNGDRDSLLHVLNQQVKIDTNVRAKNKTVMLISSELKKMNKESTKATCENNKKISQIDSTLNIIAVLNIPIGWNLNEAPASWFREKSTKMTVGNTASETSFLRYLHHRNNSTDWLNIVRYIVGIAISAFSLSFGAPFWFEMLIKLVNVRRAGKAPEVAKK
jgi:hypothetical protein